MKTKWQMVRSYGLQFVVLISAFALEVYKGNTEAAIWVVACFAMLASEITSEQLIQAQQDTISLLDKIVSIDRARNKP